MWNFEKLWHIPGHLEDHIPARAVCSYAHAQERPKKALSSQLWLTLSLWVSRKWRLRQGCHLSGWFLTMCPNTHIKSLSKDWEAYWFQVSKRLRKSLPSHELNIKLTNRNFSGYIQQRVRTLQNYFRKVVKQIVTAIRNSNNNKAWGEILFPELAHYFICQFSGKNCEVRKENLTHTQEKKRNSLWRSQDSGPTLNLLF